MEGNNKVIIIGTDHHNVLGTVRCFGVNKIKPYGIIVKNDDSPIWVTKSKYWKQTFIIDSDERIGEILKENFIEEKLKPIIICCSDGAMCYVDMHLYELKEHFIVPSLNDEQGAIACLMNKEAQFKFLKENGIKALESKIINLSNVNNCKFDYPIILKPVDSLEGDKKDIAICYNNSDFEKNVKLLMDKNYKRVLLQKYLKNKIEYLLSGFVTKENISYTVCRNIRQWPLNTGSGCYSCFVNNEGINGFLYDVLKTLQKFGFQGTIDIEIFFDENDFYVNEINWRTSGRNYCNLYNKVYSSYFYYLDCIGNDISNFKLLNDKQGYVINESSDMQSVMNSKSISLLRWFVQLVRSKGYALWFIKDLRPALSRYRYYIKKAIMK